MSKLISLDEYEKRALEILPENARDYYQSGAGNEKSLAWNRADFSNFRIRPKVLRDVSKRDTSVNIFNTKIEFPIGISPTAMQKMAHTDGETATAKAAANENVIAIFSTIATTSIEDIAAAAPNSIKWFQLYIYRDRKLTENLVRRAEAAGFKALVLTVDAPLFGLRRRDLKNKFSMPPHLKLANFQDVVLSMDGSGINEYVARQFDQSISWDDVKWLMNFTNLPIILKGIMTKEDARLACKLGVSGIMVSNHGARQIDNTASSIEALAEVAAEVKDEIPIFFDGGIREATDILIALALGAKMCFIGRPVVYGLACAGQEGVEDVIRILKREFDLAMCLAGVKNVSEINRDMVVHKNYYARL
ncbi:hypothetical protein PVAND_012436 [Polypedilum vanderplanki]|uniref:(S)-2-hydroxy-acid oxidase n=1 Tax=Polypedilum vanderplanki TaxID=319348 RepID=A0A9J6CMF6_POLVA|nr:hypothetical protein PVAND_012436 [Polypedilum vanderplanki]